MTLASFLMLGFLLGMRHAMDADHVAAVATLATRSRSIGQTVLQGVAWGTGHAFTLMLFGGAVLVAGLVVPAQAAQALELAVGVMLVGLGADALYRLWRQRIHLHVHRHAGDHAAHFRARPQRGESAAHEAAPHDHAYPRRLAGRALVVGMMHGMAGSAALILLSLEAVRSPAGEMAYVAVFGLGSILGMATLSLAIAVPLRLTSRRLAGAHTGLSAGVGLTTVMLGCYIVYEAGVATLGF